MFKKHLSLLLVVFVIFSYFWLRGAIFLDPDFGWHVRIGQLIAKNGIPATDPFSYTMSSYPSVDHEWLTDVFLAKGMGIFGYSFWAAFFAVIAVAAYSLQLLSVSEKAKRFAWPFLLLALLSVAAMIGIRPQILTWFFFSLVLLVVRSGRWYERYRWFLPLLFLLWVNLHGGFVAGVVALMLGTVYWCYKNSAQRLTNFFVFAVSIAVTFLTPYGWRSWWEVWMTMTDGNLRWSVAEWMPAVFVPDLLLWLFIIFSVMFVVRYIKRYSLLDIVLYFCFLVAGISSIRNAPLWLLVAIPLTIEAVVFFYQDISHIKFAPQRFAVMAKLFVAIMLLFALLDTRPVFYALGFFGKHNSYPEQAVSYLSKHPSRGQIFSFYDWGGYLIWKDPSKKVFIDGRMPSWRWNANLPGESNYAFDDYQRILSGKISLTSMVDRYHVDTLLLPLPGDQHKNTFENMLENFTTKVLHLPMEKEVGFSKLSEEAKKAGWVVVYKDDTAMIYRR